MKKSHLFLLLTCTVSSIALSQPGYTEDYEDVGGTLIADNLTIRKKVPLKENSVLFLLSNDSCWHSFPIMQNSKNWFGTMFGPEPATIPEKIISSPTKWSGGTAIALHQVYDKDLFLDTAKEVTNKTAPFRECTHFLENKSTQSASVSKKITFEQALDLVRTENFGAEVTKAENKGYNNGYAAGEAATKLYYELAKSEWIKQAQERGIEEERARNGGSPPSYNSLYPLTESECAEYRKIKSIMNAGGHVLSKDEYVDLKNDEFQKGKKAGFNEAVKKGY